MGYDLENSRPKHAGFMIIGTQNPVSMGGRHELYSAVLRRTYLCKVKPYTRLEMREILLSKGINPRTADTLIKDYLVAREYAKYNNLSPKPTFRLLERIAKEQTTELQKRVFEHRAEEELDSIKFQGKRCKITPFGYM